MINGKERRVKKYPLTHPHSYMISFFLTKATYAFNGKRKGFSTNGTKMIAYMYKKNEP
jgi:hypothetical protein